MKGDKLGYEGFFRTVLICTYRQGLNSASLQPPSPDCGREQRFGDLPWATCSMATHQQSRGTSPDGRVLEPSPRSRESSEQHEALSNIGGQGQKEETASGLHGLPVMSVGWCFYTFLLELVLFFLPRQVARRVTSELAADGRSHHSC